MSGYWSVFQQVSKISCPQMLIIFSGTSLIARLLRKPLLWPSKPNIAIEDASALETTSPASHSTQFTLLRAWLYECDSFHSCIYRTETRAFLPTRLLFVGNTNDQSLVSLQLTSEMYGAPYIALSHRWGTILDEEKRLYCTTQDNISYRLDGFNIFDLPKTFRDAIWVTRNLDVQYLWIDSLCIIQTGDGGEDWRTECKSMESVFSSAYCTIAATSATNMKDGFLGRASPEYLHVRSLSDRRFYICASRDNFELDVDKAELNTRAWVMQERVLSRRTIHFSANQMYWDCGEGVRCESLTKIDR